MGRALRRRASRITELILGLEEERHHFLPTGASRGAPFFLESTLSYPGSIRRRAMASPSRTRASAACWHSGSRSCTRKMIGSETVHFCTSFSLLLDTIAGLKWRQPGPVQGLQGESVN